MDALEYILFGVLVLANFALGLYFSFHKRGLRAVSNYAALEVFLGSRTLMMLPLAASTVASLLSSIGLVALPSHYYVYGWHIVWGSLTPLLVLPLATHVFVPVIYGLDVTSIFQDVQEHSSMMDALEYILFGVPVLVNFALGLYFSFYKRGRQVVAESVVLEVFLGVAR
ncbi:hypothetical protein MTO96_042467 [Rhipicephalus appendiculatus]